MKSSLCQAGDCVGVVNAVEAGHCSWIVEGNRTIVICDCEDVAKFDVIYRDHISIGANII